jgi:kynurenine formamidase
LTRTQEVPVPRPLGRFAVATSIAALAAFGALAAACDNRRDVPATPPRVVDLGHPLSAADPTWSGAPVFTRTVVASFDRDGYTAGAFSTEEHFGTHLDAPAHFAKDGWTVDRIPVERLVRSAVCIDVRDKVAGAEDYQVSVDDVRGFERQHGAIPEGALVLIATGWDERWPSQDRYMNVREGVKHFPGISPDAARLLAAERRVAGIGIDTASIDYGPASVFEAHQTTQPHDVYHIENAAHLTSLPAAGFTVVVAPANVKDGSGAPARVFALLPR